MPRTHPPGGRPLYFLALTQPRGRLPQHRTAKQPGRHPITQPLNTLAPLARLERPSVMPPSTRADGGHPPVTVSMARGEGGHHIVHSLSPWDEDLGAAHMRSVWVHAIPSPSILYRWAHIRAALE